jgi:hypothetical protein
MRTPMKQFARPSGLLAVIGSLAIALLAPAPAAAKTLHVCPSGCDYSTIHAALVAADDGDRILIAPGTYAGGFAIDDDVSLIGAGAAATTISGGGTVATVNPGASAAISRVTITGGSFRGVTVHGGATLTLSNSVVRNNGSSVGFGGGIQNELGGTLILEASTVRANSAGFGAGVSNEGSATLTKTDVSENVASTRGAGIRNFNSATITLDRSTVSDNNSAQDGGGAVNFGTMTLKKSTVEENSAGVHGGGIYNETSGSLMLETSAITKNIAGVNGGGIFNAGGAVTQTNSKITRNRPNDCFGC